MQELERILEEIDLVKEEIINLDCGDDYNAGIRDMAMMAKQIIHKHRNDGWIPVGERLPEAGEHVIVSFKCTGFQPVIAHLSEEGRWMMLQGAKGFNDVTNKVSAWRPLPEPYMPEKIENNPQAD